MPRNQGKAAEGGLGHPWDGAGEGLSSRGIGRASSAELRPPGPHLGLGPHTGHERPYLPTVSCSHFSNKAFRACAPDVRGSV